jgi:hypothetical protein
MFLAGNFFDSNVEMGRYDANQGNVLSFGSESEMTASRLGKLRLTGQARRVREIEINGEKCLVLVKNNDKAQIIRALKN